LERKSDDQREEERMPKPTASDRPFRLDAFDLRSQFVWILLVVLGLLVTIVGWYQWTIS
jgi:hypothetical protein